MNIGDPVPQTRVPALIQGQLCRFTLSQTVGTRMVICCVSSITEVELLLLNSQIHRFDQCQTSLLALATEDFPFSCPWSLDPKTIRIPLLADPLKRLSRRLGLSRSISSPRCESLLFNKNSRLEFRLIHDLNIRGLAMLLEIFDLKRRQDRQLEGANLPAPFCTVAQ